MQDALLKSYLGEGRVPFESKGVIGGHHPRQA